ncbi:hypothetical protein MKW94_015695 [Papaver nudicaule]|uniref:Mitochondrial processing peptidase n=1 Tax=Papaver nudicaule TaxID=74823 RepID=A0AA42B2V5_PAPNU|nr:hypothetical protein [Papaver nudicaule]MCL7049393.1 hypothetical protein [Papaver nudicaule]
MALKHLLEKAHRFQKPYVLCHPTFIQPSRFCSTSESSPQITYQVQEIFPYKQHNRVKTPNPKFLQYITTLPNGLRVATESNLSTKTATIGAWIDAGSRHDTDDTSGVAHYVEHMKFEGTYDMRKEFMDAKIELMGGYFDAIITREHTAYRFKIRDENVPMAIDILADTLQRTSYGGDEINCQRDTILREMEAVERCPETRILCQLHATAFQGSPLGRTVLGDADFIKTTDGQPIYEYISTHYTAPRMVIVAAGAVKHEDVVEEVKKHFTRLPTNPTTASQLAAKELAIFTGSEVRIIDNDLPLAHFAVAFAGASLTDPDSIALMVMKSMLGSWNKSEEGGKLMGSELSKRVAIKEIAESMMTFNDSYKDAGLFGIYACAKPDCLDDLADAIMYEISKLSNRVSEDDVNHGRNQLKSSLLLQLDGTTPVARDIGAQLLAYGRRIPYVEMFARIDAVDASTIKRVAKRFLFNKDIAIAATGPIQGLPDYNWFRSRTHSP